MVLKKKGLASNARSNIFSKATLVVNRLEMIQHSPSPLPPPPPIFHLFSLSVLQMSGLRWPLILVGLSLAKCSEMKSSCDPQCLAQLSWLLHPLLHTWHCRNTYYVILFSVGLWSTTLSTIKAYNGYHTCHRVLWINPAANITFSVITLETEGIQTFNPDVGRWGLWCYHSTVQCSTMK